MSLCKHLAQNLNAIRSLRNKSLTEFAEELCIARSSLQSILRGECNLRMDTITHIADRLDTEPLSLLQDSYTAGELAKSILLLDALDNYKKLSAEDRAEAADLFQRLICVLDKASDL